MKVKVQDLKHHPLNGKIYLLSGLDDLISSIHEIGLLEPLTINKRFEVLSGNRRFECIIRLGWEEVEVNVSDVDPSDEIIHLIHYNRQRVKTIRELLNEYSELEAFYKNSGVIGQSVRSKVSTEINVPDGRMARILYIWRRKPEYITFIDDGIITLNQAYLNVHREEEERHSRDLSSRPVVPRVRENDDLFTFYEKSSETLDEIDDGSVQCVFTSPPYALGVRRYSENVSIGSEETVEEYAENLSNHLTSCFRVLNDRGSFFLNLGDVYVDGHLQSAPHRVIFKLLEKTDFILRNTIVYKKSNPKPSSVKNRSSNSYEFIFHLVKTLDYDFEKMTLPLSPKTKMTNPPRHRSTNDTGGINLQKTYVPSSKGKNLPDFWDDDLIVTSVANQSLNNGLDHPAMYHPSLVTIPLLQTCVLPFVGEEMKSKDPIVVMDPFCGALNTYKSIQWINDAFGTQLKFIGYDLKKYF